MAASACDFGRLDEPAFITGPNLYHLTQENNEEHYRKVLFEWLEENPSERSVRILINKRASGDPPDVETQTHTEHSQKVFRKWAAAAEHEGLMLKVRWARIVRTSATFTDHGRQHGKLVLVPDVAEPTSGNRSCFLLTAADNEELFRSYCEQYNRLFFYSQVFYTPT